jgi:cytochrome c
MLKNVLVSIVFVVAVIALINFIGDVVVNPATAPQTPRPLTAEVTTQAAEQAAMSEAAPELAPETAPELGKEPVAAPEADEADEADEAELTAAIAGDADAGKSMFRKKCMGCHTAAKGEPNRTGPNLWDIVGREKGASEGYRYSTPMKALGGAWSEADILGFIAGPRTFLPDTKMTFAGIKNEQDRADILAYLKTLKD